MDQPPSYDNVIMMNRIVLHAANQMFITLTKDQFITAFRCVCAILNSHGTLRETSTLEYTQTFLDPYLYHAANIAVMNILSGLSSDEIVKMVTSKVYYYAWFNNALWVPLPENITSESEDDTDSGDDIFQDISNVTGTG
jgi:hypothetical protein